METRVPSHPAVVSVNSTVIDVWCQPASRPAVRLESNHPFIHLKDFLIFQLRRDIIVFWHLLFLFTSPVILSQQQQQSGLRLSSFLVPLAVISYFKLTTHLISKKGIFLIAFFPSWLSLTLTLSWSIYSRNDNTRSLLAFHTAERLVSQCPRYERNRYSRSDLSRSVELE